jgi:hypothetical protein
MIDYNSVQLKNFINERGEIILKNREEFNTSVRKAEEITEALLGCTLMVRNKPFIISMLELYYGSMADTECYWYRTNFMVKKSTRVGHLKLHDEPGLKVYINVLNDISTYQNFNIIVGPMDVPVCILVRSVFDQGFRVIGKTSGSPKLIMKAMDISSKDHGKEIVFSDRAIEDVNHEFVLIDTHREVYEKGNFVTRQRRRINVNPEFEDKYHLEWNFYMMALK